jgi:hypothetical protein
MAGAVRKEKNEDFGRGAKSVELARVFGIGAK